MQHKFTFLTINRLKFMRSFGGKNFSFKPFIIISSFLINKNQVWKGVRKNPTKIYYICGAVQLGTPECH